MVFDIQNIILYSIIFVILIWYSKNTLKKQNRKLFRDLNNKKLYFKTRLVQISTHQWTQKCLANWFGANWAIVKISTKSLFPLIQHFKWTVFLRRSKKVAQPGNDRNKQFRFLALAIFLVLFVSIVCVLFFARRQLLVASTMLLSK